VDLASKLQIKPGVTVTVLSAPEGVALPTFPSLARAADAEAWLGFVVLARDLSRIAGVLRAAQQDRLAWVAYPKAGKLGTDLNRDSLSALLTARGLTPVRQIAIDDTWSALRFRPAS
jgi:hypothetical protein